MKKSKSRNYKNVPVSRTQMEQAIEKAKNDGTNTAWAIFSMVLFDKHGFDQNSFKSVWNETVRISNGVGSGELDMFKLVSDIEKCGINFSMKPYEIPKNPTHADLNRAKRWAEQIAQSTTWTLMLTALKHEENPGDSFLRKIYDEMLYLRDSLDRGIIKPKELHRVLYEEAEIALV